MRMMECQLCGAEIEYRPARKYCNQCRKIKDDEWYQSHKKESKNDIIKRLEEENKNLIRADKKKTEHIDELERRISDLEELLTQYDPEWNESK